MNREENLFQRLWSFIYPGKNTERENADANVREGVEYLHHLISQGEPDYDVVWTRICRKVVKHRRIRRKTIWWYAAAIALPLSIGILAAVVLQWEEKALPVAIADLPIKPGMGNGVTLTLSSGDIVDIEKMERNVTVEQVVVISRDSKEGLTYRAQQVEDTVIRYNTLEVPVAADYKLQLADGTVVYMNSDSKLRFPVMFSGNERKVHLEGEAYFEVAKDAGKPFRVSVGDLEVEVLGTVFNINAYGDCGEIQTTLLDGSVLVKQEGERVVLKPGEQAGCSVGQIVVRKVDVREFVSWKDGMFFFNGMTLENIMLQIRRWYGIDATFLQQELRDYTFTGMIDKNLTAEEIFRIIEKTMKVHFLVTGNQVMIKKL